MNYQEQHGTQVLNSEQQVGVYDADGNFHQVDFQIAFDVLKDLNLAHHVPEEDRKFLHVQ